MILENPQHERFALFVAGGLSPEEAYVQALAEPISDKRLHITKGN